jgi:uncharacterized protein (TIGR02118 family)
VVKIILLLYRRPDLSAEAFRRYWHEQHRPLLERLPGLQRLVLNDVVPVPGGAPSACDGISEDWFESAEAMQAAFASPEGQATARDVAELAPDGRVRSMIFELEDV